ncbi:MAG: hypothetical protein SGILL_009827, partial [Bacillariaceae sp.]
WPPVGPEKEPIFPHLSRWMRNMTEIPSPYTPQMYDVYNNQLSLDVSLLNMHDTTRDLLDDFLCSSLVRADHACQEYRRARSSDQSVDKELYRYASNPSENPFCDQLAFQAYQHGIIRDLRGHRKGADRLFFNEVISRRLSKMKMTPFDLPLTCPSSLELQPFLDRSLLYEQEFFPDFYSSSLGRPVMEAKFWKDIDKQKFCSVNTTAVLAQSDWIRFFQTQWKPKRGQKPKDWEFTTYKITNKNFTGK